MKKIMSSVLICCLSLLLFCSVAFASDTDAALNPSPDENYAQSEQYVNLSRAAGTILEAQSFMVKSNRTIQCKAEQRASALCDKIGAYFTLQKWNGSSWYTYDTDSAYISSTAASAVVVTFSNVSPGTYRLKASHRAYSGSTIKSSVTTTTSSLTVS